jgi:hypothetical protein
MQVRSEGPSLNTSDIYIRHDRDVTSKGQMEVLSPYFKDLQSEHSVSAYFASSVLGSPRIRLLYWQGRPAAHWSLFPFPYWIDGKKVVGGKPEGAAIHRDLLRQLARPDLFSMVVDELLAQARDTEWPLLFGITNPLGRTALKKKGFQDVTMAALETFWPLRAEEFITRAIGHVSRSHPSLSKALPGPLLRETIRWAMKTLSALARIKTALRSSPYELIDLPLEDLGRYSCLMENNYWPDRRLTVWREPNFLESRLRAVIGYRLLGVWSRVEHKIMGLAIVKSDGGALSLQEILPPALSVESDIWLELIRYAIRAGASSLKTRSYLNNSVHVAMARQLPLRLAAHTATTKFIFSLLVLDPKFTFASDPSVWAGTDMLMAGF